VRQAGVDVLLGGLGAGALVDEAVDAVGLVDAVAGPEAVGPVGKGAVGDAAAGAGAVAAEAGGGVQDGRGEEVACFPGFVPVSVFWGGGCVSK